MLCSFIKSYSRYPVGNRVIDVVEPQIVVYFDQQTGAPQDDHWLKSIFEAKTTFCILLGHKIMQKITKNLGLRGLLGVNQL